MERDDIDLLLSEAPFVEYKGRSYSRLQIVSAAYRLSQQLPDTSNIINLHDLRHEFMVVLMATAFKQVSAILPPSIAKNALLTLVEGAKNLISSSQPLYSDLSDYLVPAINFSSLLNDSIIDRSLLEEKVRELPNGVIKIYTSGTTGHPKQVIKSWYSMSKMASKAIDRFHLTSDKIIVGTIPSQHMFGLETTVFWPLFSTARLWSEKPLFAGDMMDVFENSHGEILLVSTPLHLKNWVESQGGSWPSRKVSVLSATAPMDKELAEKATMQWQVRLFEVLGSTETASFASREIMSSELWEPYQNTNIQLSGSKYEVSFTDLGEFYPLQDEIQMEVGGRFKLLGRQSDMIKVAGKRASLCELNRVLLSIDGVRDGVFLNLGKERLSAVVESDLPIKDIKQKLNESMDSVFLPRPIYFIDNLPRNELGKLQMNKLLEEIDGRHND
ncbi:AMP-binding protein [Hydrogenovibrio kuenenii]|uniref:AMP-binding protein n=1 Tax=Hydrogenovibrio kuenenii TaxID=63658 RepID=UPI0012FE994D|nr:class I adenylate-forming enzyme family protein [Hydrogenovibrio kuenenii]